MFADTMVAILGQLARVGTRPRTVVLDNARYQTCAAVTAEADRLGIELMYRAAIKDGLGKVGTEHRGALATLMAPQLQTFDKSSVLAA